MRLAQALHRQRDAERALAMAVAEDVLRLALRAPRAESRGVDVAPVVARAVERLRPRQRLTRVLWHQSKTMMPKSLWPVWSAAAVVG